MAPRESSGMSRRAFLAASGGLVIAAAAMPEVAFAHDAPKLGKGLNAAVLSSNLFAQPTPQRFVFGLLSKRGYVSGPPVHVGFAPPDTTETTLEFAPTQFFKAGLPEGRGVYVAQPVLDVPGVWKAVAQVEKRQITFAIEVREASTALLPGAAAPRDASPTPSDTLGVKPICTRSPKCPLHDTSLTELIGSGTPVAVLFATPARCQSEYCGPVLDTLLSVRDAYPDFAFAHVEIYKNNKTIDLAPTVEAWGLPSEPWLYTIDGAGTIVGALDGAFGKGEIKDLLDNLS
ncbi:MAG: hypothetical protein EXQ79_03985 [Acidimicrobiia bacterium]|nr:hypothetical protein [Acidimicrobiia bacterium]